MMNILKVLRIASEVNQLTDDEVKMLADFVSDETADHLEHLLEIKLIDKKLQEELTV